MLLAAALGLGACGSVQEAEVQTGESDLKTVESEMQTEESESLTEELTEGLTESESVETEDSQEDSTEPESTETVSTEPDVTPPVLEGVANQTVIVGENVSYKKGVTVSDDSGNCTLEVDTSDVDLSTPGTYEVIYRAMDEAGNETSRIIVLTVTEPATVTEEEVYALADQVIASVTTEEMTRYEKAEALWKWCRKQISYSYSAGERGLIAGAYEGLHDRRGDCYAYYATYEVLLTRAGIENMCVTRISGNSNHWWNLVNVGDGWYHCDTSPRKKGHKFRCFMQTDEQIAAYTEVHTQLYPDSPNYYTFEGELYPERSTEIIVETQIP